MPPPISVNVIAWPRNIHGQMGPRTLSVNVSRLTSAAGTYPCAPGDKGDAYSDREGAHEQCQQQIRRGNRETVAKQAGRDAAGGESLNYSGDGFLGGSGEPGA